MAERITQKRWALILGTLIGSVVLLTAVMVATIESSGASVPPPAATAPASTAG